MSNKSNGVRITKKEFNALGGLQNSDLYRKADKSGRYRYYRVYPSHMCAFNC